MFAAPGTFSDLPALMNCPDTRTENWGLEQSWWEKYWNSASQLWSGRRLSCLRRKREPGLTSHLLLLHLPASSRPVMGSRVSLLRGSSGQVR